MDFSTISMALIGGALFGGVVGYVIALYRSKDNSSKVQLVKLQTEMDEYKSSVRSHFIDTVSLLSQIDQRQKQLHRTVAEGVVDLCASEDNDSDYLLEQSVHALSQLDQNEAEKPSG